jgi:hypothetical protein
MVPVAFAIAAVSALWMLLHIARRYPSVPKRIPWRMRWDGRPSGQSIGKWFLWVAPAILVTVFVLVAAMVRVVGWPPAEGDATLALMFIVFAEVAYLVAWSADRQIELARKMTYRVSPARTLRAALPVLLTVAVLLLVAARL